MYPDKLYILITLCRYVLLCTGDIWLFDLTQISFSSVSMLTYICLGKRPFYFLPPVGLSWCPFIHFFTILAGILFLTSHTSFYSLGPMFHLYWLELSHHLFDLLLLCCLLQVLSCLHLGLDNDDVCTR